MRFSRVLGSSVLGFSLVALAAAQPVRSSHLPPGAKNGPYVKKTIGSPDFGPSTVSSYRIAPSDFEVDDSNTTFTGSWSPGDGNYNYTRWITGGFEHLFATVHLPGGAKLDSWDFAYCDDNGLGGGHMTFNLWDCTADGACDSTPLGSFDTSTFGAGCFNPLQVTPAIAAYTVDNAGHFLLVDVIFGAMDGTNRLATVGVSYQLQVSPAPATATFNDVPTSDPAFQYVEALVASGITAGCGGGNYCPDNPVTRRQMAVFLAKALGLNWNQ